jgi:ribosome biogenesis GTPase A
LEREIQEDATQKPLLRELQATLTSAQERENDLFSSLARSRARSAALERRLHVAAQMLNTTSDLLFHCNDEGQTDFFNDAFEAAFSAGPDLALWVSAVREGASGRGEYQYKDRYGRVRVLKTASWPSIPTAGHIGAATDVTEIREMEEESLRLRRLMGRFILQNGLLPEPAEWSPAEAVEQADSFDTAEILKSCLNDALRFLSPVAALESPAQDVLLPARISQFKELLHFSDRTELEVGVVGITSSGKSTFINAMMGERLLPEETRATTNLLVRCRRGSERAVTVITRDGRENRVSGAALNPAWMEELTTERLNPANEKNIERLEWTSPGAALPDGLVLIDTPGLDACDFPEHSELVLRRLLPSLDIVLYVTSIRNRFKAADLELLQNALESSQRVIFLLSQIDLEQDDTEGGRVVFSRRQKLSDCIRELREDIENIASENGSLKNSAVVPVSSKLASAYFYDRSSPAWAASNFGPLIRQMETFRDNLERCGIATCARRLMTFLSRTASDLGLILGGAGAEQMEAEGAARLERIRELRDAHRWTSAEVSAVRNEWRRLLDAEYHLQNLGKELEKGGPLKVVRESYERWGEECAALASRMTARMDRARMSCREILLKLGIAFQGRGGEAPEISGELPEFYGYVRHETRQVQTRGWFESLQFWPRYQLFFRQNVDRDKLLSSLQHLLKERLHVLNEYLTWWENAMREDWCEPLCRELEREETALNDIRRIAADVSVSRSSLRTALSGIRELEGRVRNIMPELSLPDIDPDDLFPDDLFDRFDALKDSGEAPEEDDASENVFGELFAPLLAAFREQDIQSRFLKTEALRGRGKIVLLGLRRHDSLRFLSRLAHDVFFFDAGRTETDERDWIFCGREVPAALPHVQIEAPDTALSEMEILLAPGDGLCGSPDVSPIDWDSLFSEWTPVVHLDAARIDSGLSDLARAPYATALLRSEGWVAASGQGALFNGRLADLLQDVPDRMDDFLRKRGGHARPDWFIYENYDARYSDFLLWGREILALPEMDASAGGSLLLDRWTREGYDFIPPFSEHRLRRAVEGALYRKRGEWKRSDTD